MRLSIRGRAFSVFCDFFLSFVLHIATCFCLQELTKLSAPHRHLQTWLQHLTIVYLPQGSRCKGLRNSARGINTNHSRGQGVVARPKASCSTASHWHSHKQPSVMLNNSRARASDLSIKGWALAFSVFWLSVQCFRLNLQTFSFITFHNLVSFLTMGTSYAFASAFLSGIFWIKEPDASYNFGNPASRMRRFRALLPLPTTKEYIPLFEAVDLEDYIVSIDCWFPS